MLNHKVSKIILLALCLGLVLEFSTKVYFNYTKSRMVLEALDLDLQEFQAYIEEYSKNYNQQEFLLRFKNFKDNLAYIRVFNLQDNTWKLGVNFFADLSYEEYKTTYLPHKFQKSKSQQIEPQSLSQQPYPPTVDWRTKGAVTPVKNQQACGGCYAFSAVSSIESAWFIAGHPLTSFSEQCIIDCSSAYGNDHCYGGLVDQAFEYVKAKGLPTEATYPYLSANEKCNHTLADQVAVKITGYVDVQANSSSALLTAIAQQPISVGVEADQLSWTFYKSGVITKDCGISIDHAVVIDGYDTTQNPPYYIVRNSWGPKWGMAGYVLIEIKDGPGMCGIQQLPSYPYF
jgi:C1A family cysteine protease